MTKSYHHQGHFRPLPATDFTVAITHPALQRSQVRKLLQHCSQLDNQLHHRAKPLDIFASKTVCFGI
jgi:hypothetical protein